MMLSQEADTRLGSKSIVSPPKYTLHILSCEPIFMQEIGEEWVVDLYQLKRLLPLSESERFLREIFTVKKVSHTTSITCHVTVM